MDKKQTNLSPELKEIYDRVMNTSATPKPNVTPTPPTQTPPQADKPSHPENQPAHAAAPSEMPKPGISMPSIPDAADQALTSSPPRPASTVDGTKPFSFSGTASTSKNDAKPGEKKSKISLPILIILGIAFIAVWGVFWLVMLGFINR